MKCRGRKTWEGGCVNDDMKLLGLQSEGAIFRDLWMGFIRSKRLTLDKCGRNGNFQNK